MSLSLLPRADQSCLPCLPVAIVTRCAGAVRAVLMLRHTLLQVLLDTPLPRAVSQCLGLCRRLICAAI